MLWVRDGLGLRLGFRFGIRLGLGNWFGVRLALGLRSCRSACAEYREISVQLLITFQS